MKTANTEQIAFDVAEYIAYNAERLMEDYVNMAEINEDLMSFIERRVAELMGDKYTIEEVYSSMDNPKVKVLLDFFFEFEGTKH